MMHPAIIAIGTANPIYKQDQLSAAEIVAKTLNLDPRERKLLKTLYRFTGINTRHSVLSDVTSSEGLRFFNLNERQESPSTAERMEIYKQEALPLALTAIEDCLAQLEDFETNEISHLIVVSCTGMYAPGLDIELVQELGLKPSTQRTCVNFMGCYGAFNGVKLAHAITQADPSATVLVLCIELCSIHFQHKTDLDSLTSNAIFADGASCVLIKSNYTQKKSLQLSGFHCDLLPQTNQEMAWHVGDTGFDMVLTSYVPEAIGKGISYFLKTMTEKAKLNSEAVHYYAIHPGAKKILKACEQALNITAEDNRYSYSVLENYGNMSSATIFFVLKLIWQDIASPQHHNKNIFSCAFGPGLTLESMILRTNYVS